jgi:hypothetical protein
VTLEQLNWRRATINGPECQGRLELFHQEHPATPEQAFIGSGHPVFSRDPGVAGDQGGGGGAGARHGRAARRGWQEKRTRAGTILVPQRAVWVPEADVNEEDRDLWGFRERLLVWEHPVNAGDGGGQARGGAQAGRPVRRVRGHRVGQGRDARRSATTA